MGSGGIAFVPTALMIVFRQKYPQGMFDFTVGVMRWSWPVWAYAILLTTDRSPPFSTE